MVSLSTIISVDLTIITLGLAEEQVKHAGGDGRWRALWPSRSAYKSSPGGEIEFRFSCRTLSCLQM